MASQHGVPRSHELPDAPPGDPATVVFDGQSLPAIAGEPLAVTLLANGIDIASRSVKYHRPRGAFCLAGTCAQCWMRVDGIPNRAACTTPVKNGMTADRENAFPSAELDLFRAADIVFPGGLDHHTLGTTPVTLVNQIIGSTARQMAGLGTLAENVPAAAPAMKRVACDVLVVGGGPAGLAAAEAAAEAGLGVLLVEKRRELGGQILTGLFDDDAVLMGLADRARAALERNGGQAWVHTVALGVYSGTPQTGYAGTPQTRDGTREVLLRRFFGLPEEHLVTVRPDAIVFATGGYEQAALFSGNDLPGHYGARALGRLAVVRRVLPGKKVAIVEGPTPVETARRLAARLEKMGCEVTRVSASPTAEAGVLGARTPLAARGRTRIKALELASTTDARTKPLVVSCSVVASAHPPAPAFELPAQAGAQLDHRSSLGGFVVRIEPSSGATTAARIFAAGDVTGATTARRAALSGRRAGLSAALSLGTDAAHDATLLRLRDDTPFDVSDGDTAAAEGSLR